MPFYANIGTNSTSPSDLAESTKHMHFLSVIEVADLLARTLTFTSTGDADERRADAMRERQVEAMRAESI